MAAARSTTGQNTAQPRCGTTVAVGDSSQTMRRKLRSQSCLHRGPQPAARACSARQPVDKPGATQKDARAVGTRNTAVDVQVCPLIQCSWLLDGLSQPLGRYTPTMTDPAGKIRHPPPRTRVQAASPKCAANGMRQLINVQEESTLMTHTTMDNVLWDGLQASPMWAAPAAGTWVQGTF